jgi:hypothetical protein
VGRAAVPDGHGSPRRRAGDDGDAAPPMLWGRRGPGVSLWSVGRVEPEDDSIRRFIVHHYRYDPARRERRHVVVAAFDNEQEFLACVQRVRAEIAQRRERDAPVDPREHASGVVHEPGYLRRAANGHLVRRAFKHRVVGLQFEESELPFNMVVFRADPAPN